MRIHLWSPLILLVIVASAGVVEGRIVDIIQLDHSTEIEEGEMARFDFIVRSYQSEDLEYYVMGAVRIAGEEEWTWDYCGNDPTPIPANQDTFFNRTCWITIDLEPDLYEVAGGVRNVNYSWTDHDLITISESENTLTVTEVQFKEPESKTQIPHLLIGRVILVCIVLYWVALRKYPKEHL